MVHTTSAQAYIAAKRKGVEERGWGILLKVSMAVGCYMILYTPSLPLTFT